ncbi:MAG: sigma-70 family RNA polymerase sigma factor [Bacteroides sp.]|nr:sigma-70 family RNA polymerase sigma factor [Bacteroides sp.]
MEITQLIERCKQGDADALGELYKAYAHRMKGVCRRYISDEQAVNDVLHDAFVIIFTSFDRLRDARKAESWMMAITRNVASKYKDHLLALPTVPLEEAICVLNPDEEAIVRGIPMDEVMRRIDQLPEGYAKVFRLSVFAGMSHKEIAAMLDIEPHSSSSQLTRAKKMLQKSLAQYWMLWLLPLLCSVTFYLLKINKPTKAEQYIVTKHDKRPATKESETPEVSGDSIVPVQQIVILPVRRQMADTVIPKDSLPHSQSQDEHTDTATMHTDHPLPDVRRNTDMLIAETPDTLPNIDDIIQEKKRSSLSTMLAYTGMPSNGTSIIDNFLTVVDYASGGKARSTRIYNWGEYIDYVNNYASEMDSVEAMNMRRIAMSNAQHPNAPLSERKYHERPHTFELSLSYPLSKRWSLTSGLSYTRMKSTFESDDGNMLIRRTQKLHYIGLPLKLTYTLLEKNRWQLYTSGGIGLDIPVRGKETTQYLYMGQYPSELGDSLILPTTHARVKTSWQWSVNIGIGVQYQLLPHVNAYFEPRLQYYIPTGSPTETYRTEHPFDLSLPFGIRFTW